MPEFNADGSLRIISDSYVWGDPLDYSSLTLAPLVSDQGQLKVIFTPTIMFTDVGRLDPFDPQEVLTADQLEILTTITNAVIDPDSKTITIPQPDSVDVGSYTVNGSSFTVAYFSSTVAVTPSQLLEIRRDTDVTTAVVDFQAGSRLTSEALNAANSQNLFAIQELTEFGAFISGGSGGGGTFTGSLTDITGATQLTGTVGNVVWDGSDLTATDNAQGILPYTDSAPNNAVLRVSTAATNVTGTVWEVLEANQINSWDGVGIVPSGTIASQLSTLEGKTDPITNISNLWSVTTGAAKDITLDGRNINLTADSSVDVAGNVNVGQIGDSFVLTLNGANVNNIISNAVLKTDDLDALANVSSDNPDSGSYLRWNGSAWAPSGSLDVASTTTLKYGTISTSGAANLNVGTSANPTRSLFQASSDVAGTMVVEGDTEVTSGIDQANKKFVAPSDGRYKLLYRVNANSKSGNPRMRVWTEVTVNGVIAASANSFNYRDDISSNGEITINVNEVFLDLVAGDEVDVIARSNSGGDAYSLDYWNVNIQNTTFDSSLTLSTTSTPSMNFTGFLDNQDTSSDKEVFLTSAVEAQADGWSYTGSTTGFSGSLEFSSNTSSGVFTAPRDMTLKVSYNFNWAGGNTSEDLSYQLSVDGVQWQSNKVHLKTSSVLTGVGNGDFSTLGGEWVVPLSQGQTLQLTQLAGGNTARVERLTYSVVEVLNEITANVVAQDALKVVTTDWSDRQNPLNSSSLSTYEPTQVGLGADGRPIYEIYEEITLGSSAAPGYNSVLLTGYNTSGTIQPPVGARSFLVDAYNISSNFENLTAVTSGGTTAYLGSNVTVMFGLYLDLKASSGNQIDINRNNQGFGSSTALLSGTVIGIVTRYQLSTDPLYQNYELVPVTP